MPHCILPQLHTQCLAKIRTLMAGYTNDESLLPKPLPPSPPLPAGWRPLNDVQSINTTAVRLPFARPGQPFSAKDFLSMLKNHLVRLFVRDSNPAP